jgi:hypothetical protein
MGHVFVSVSNLSQSFREAKDFEHWPVQMPSKSTSWTGTTAECLQWASHFFDESLVSAPGIVHSYIEKVIRGIDRLILL